MATMGVSLTACITAATIAYSPTSFYSREWPPHLVVLSLLITTALLVVTARFSSARYASAQDRHNGYTAIPLRELPDGTQKGTKEKQSLYSHALERSTLVLLTLLAIIILSVRIGSYRNTEKASECSVRSIEVWLPFLIAIYDAVRFQRHLSLITTDEEDLALDSTIYTEVTRTWKDSLLQSRWRYVPASFLFSLGCHMVAGLWSPFQSTIVCPLSSTDLLAMPNLLWLNLGLDTFLAIVTFELALGGMSHYSSMLSAPMLFATVTGAAASCWLVVGLVVYKTQPENRAWLFMEVGPGRGSALGTLLSQSAFLSVLLTSTLYMIMCAGLLHSTFVLTATAVAVPGLSLLWSTKRPYPPLSSIHLTWSFVLIYAAWSIYNRSRRYAQPSETPPSMFRRTSIFIIFVILIFPGLLKSNTTFYHPIDLLLFDAQNKHQHYKDYAGQSHTIAEAVRLYQTRYQDNPPPGFDIWYEYAKNRSVLITDEFNQIYNDLLPFRATTPALLRDQTWEMVSNPWNEISGITIRGGKAAVQENVIPTHRWMLEGVVHILDAFSQYLPDMDLAFNLNDESRVSLTYERRQELEGKALAYGFRGTNPFSIDRAPGWKPVPEEDFRETVFENWSFRKSFREWAASTCPAGSSARKDAAPLARSQLCTTCAASHSLGQFISNWSVAADPCHQPDLAALHGFYISPAAFKPTHELRPVFSQSKAPNFNDILYPSAWNYMDKVAYAPTDTGTDDRPAFPDTIFAEKADSVFWRGATSEAVSAGQGQWRGMTRQRMVHLANNLTSSQHDSVALLLPDQRHPEKYTYISVPGSSLPSLGLQTNVHVVDFIARCAEPDCTAQGEELGLVGPEDFQSHWRYKYLIDLDGAGFSGRFLPFLKSHSLPFKAALFREWWDSRLVPWLHFVPLDLRLHGFYSTLAYFMGVKGKDGNSVVREWAGHQREAELIAEAGRAWANKVLRKEDMEVYFFRLLLEWGRLTDDKRDELGFVVT